MRKKKSAPPTKRAKNPPHKTRKTKPQRKETKTREQIKRAERRAFLKAERERLERREQRRLARERAEREAQRAFRKRSNAAKKAWQKRREQEATKRAPKRGKQREQKRGQWLTVFDQSTEGIPAFWLDAFDGMTGKRDDYANLGDGLRSALRGLHGKIVDARVTGKYTLDAITWDAFTVTAVNRVTEDDQAARWLYLAPLRRIVKRDSLASYVVESFRVRVSAEKVPHVIPEAAMRKQPKKKKRA